MEWSIFYTLRDLEINNFSPTNFCLIVVNTEIVALEQTRLLQQVNSAVSKKNTR